MSAGRNLRWLGATTVAALTLLALGGCGEKPQTLGGVKSDAAAYTGPASPGYADAGWKAGDKTSWEQHLKARTQNGQNEYARMH